MEFDEKKDSWYTLLNWQQGLLVPNTWKTAVDKVVFDGFMGTAGAYMPWFGPVSYTHLDVYKRQVYNQQQYREALYLYGKCSGAERTETADEAVYPASY